MAIEMDTSRFKRRAIQTRRQLVKPSYGNTEFVPRTSLPRSITRDKSPDSERHFSGPVSPQPEAIPSTSIGDAPQADYPLLEENRSEDVTSQNVTEQIPEVPASEQIHSGNNQFQQVIEINMDLPGDPSYLRAKTPIVHGSRRRVGRRLLFRGAVLALACIIGLGGLMFSQDYLKLHKAFKGGAPTAASLTVGVNPSLLKGEGDGRINILLLGRGGGNHDGPDLTDTMILASIDPVNHTASLISIPRDLWIDIPNEGAMKINAAWESGEFSYLGSEQTGSTNANVINAAFSQADQSVESVLGVPIDYNMIMNFQAFQQAVNTVNGVIVNVPTSLVDPTMAWENNNNPVLAQAGLQAFDGAQALSYVRSRETTSDFARAQRQRAVLVALENKVETLGIISNPLKLSSLFGEFGNNVATDLSMTDAARLYSIIKDINTNNVTSIGLADPPNSYIATGQLDGQAIDLPTAGLFNYSAIQTFVRGQLKDPYILNENAKVLVLNGTSVPGLATNMANELTSYGYNVIGASNAPNTGWTQTTLVDLSNGKDKYTLHYLEQRLNVTAENKLPDNSIQTNGADFVIIIGSNETTTPKN